jgi:hypothetical protein
VVTTDAVIVACAAGAGAHAALVPAHLQHQQALGIAFVAAAAALLMAAAALTMLPHQAGVRRASALLLATLIGAYAVNLTTGIPGPADETEPIDAVGPVTKSVDALGLLFALQINPTKGGRDTLTHKEARP